MEINEKDKVNILLNLLGERYNASHEMRERSLKFTIWLLGLGFGAVWLLLSKVSLDNSQKIFFTVFVVTLLLLAIYFLSAIHRGFINNRKVMIDIEQALKCYEKGAYVSSDSLFPEDYKGEKDSSIWEKILRVLDSHFVLLYVWVIVIAAMIILSIWLNPVQ